MFLNYSVGTLVYFEQLICVAACIHFSIIFFYSLRVFFSIKYILEDSQSSYQVSTQSMYSKVRKKIVYLTAYIGIRGIPIYNSYPTVGTSFIKTFTNTLMATWHLKYPEFGQILPVNKQRHKVQLPSANNVCKLFFKQQLKIATIKYAAVMLDYSMEYFTDRNQFRNE